MSVEVGSKKDWMFIPRAVGAHAIPRDHTGQGPCHPHSEMLGRTIPTSLFLPIYLCPSTYDFFSLLQNILDDIFICLIPAIHPLFFRTTDPIL